MSRHLITVKLNSYYIQPSVFYSKILNLRVRYMRFTEFRFKKYFLGVM